MFHQIKNNVHFVGKVDWDLQKFHGNEFSTHHGTSFNAYLIQEKKTVLIDSVWGPHAKAFVENLKAHIDLNSIDYVIANHAEPDHSGALPELLKHIPHVPVYCTANATKSLKGIYHADWNFKTVKTGDKLDIGNGKQLVFVEMAMIHWPDSMLTYLTGDNILFSNDAFGQHYASELLFNDLVDQAELQTEALKYYANILTPFNLLIDKKLKEILALGLPIDIIAPSHGIIWRKDPLHIVQQYAAWANAFQTDQITILYDTMYEGTRRQAEHIAEGIHAASPLTTIKVFNMAKSDKNDVISEVFKSKGVVLGSSTINRSYLSSMAAILDEMKGLGFKNKKGASFGCYGWSGESPKHLSDDLADAGFAVNHAPLKALWNPDDVALKAAFDFGKQLAVDWGDPNPSDLS